MPFSLHICENNNKKALTFIIKFSRFYLYVKCITREFRGPNDFKDKFKAASDLQKCNGQSENGRCIKDFFKKYR